MEWNTLVVTLSMVTLGTAFAFGAYQLVRTRRAQRRGETSAFARRSKD